MQLKLEAKVPANKKAFIYRGENVSDAFQTVYSVSLLQY